MNKNNQNPLLVTIVVTSVIVFAFAYLLFKNPPQNPKQSINNTSSTNHHGGSAVSVNNDALNSLIGKSMPDVQLLDKDGKTYTVADFKGKNTVLFFNEGLMCYPACWNQIAAFGSDTRFNSDQIQAISIVVDSAQDWQNAITKMPQLGKARTMFDTNANTSRQLGVLTTASSMHRGSLPGHTYIVLDKNSIVRYVFDDPNMAIANDMLLSKISELN